MTHTQICYRLSKAIRLSIGFQDEPMALIGTTKNVFFKPQPEVTSHDQVIVTFQPNELQTHLPRDQWYGIFFQCQKFYEERNLLE